MKGIWFVNAYRNAEKDLALELDDAYEVINEWRIGNISDTEAARYIIEHLSKPLDKLKAYDDADIGFVFDDVTESD